MIVSVLSFFSCEDILEEKVYSDMLAGILTDSEESADLLTNGALAILNSGDFFLYGHYSFVSELDCDHITAGIWSMKEYGSGNFTGDQGRLDAWWFGRYSLIQRCNFAIEKISEMKNVKEDVKNNMLGQLWFLKGWAYFQLVQAYGPVPIYTERPASPKEYNRPRRSVEDVYNYAIECLNNAGNLLYERNNPNYQLGRISKYTAKTVLAQVYCAMASGSLPAGTKVTVSGGPLWRIEGSEYVLIDYPSSYTFEKEKVEGYNFDPQYCYTRVSELCDSIIRYGGFKLYDNFMDVWELSSRNGSEFIWQLQANLDMASLRNPFSYGFNGELYKNNGHDLLRGAYYGMTHHWYRLFEHNKDDRAKYGVRHLYATQIIGWDHPLRGQPWYMYYPKEDSLNIAESIPGDKLMDFNPTLVYLTKFHAVTGKVDVDLGDYFYPFLRYSIVYLMSAEAENELGNLSKAKEMVDVVRSRAKASLISGTDMGQQEVRSFIIEERAREFAQEGVRKWDLLRWGIYLQVMNKMETDRDIRKSRERKNLLFPLPLAELNGNSEINQDNPGW